MPVPALLIAKARKARAAWPPTTVRRGRCSTALLPISRVRRQGPVPRAMAENNDALGEETDRRALAVAGHIRRAALLCRPGGAALPRSSPPAPSHARELVTVPHRLLRRGASRASRPGGGPAARRRSRRNSAGTAANHVDDGFRACRTGARSRRTCTACGRTVNADSRNRIATAATR